MEGWVKCGIRNGGLTLRVSPGVCGFSVSINYSMRTTGSGSALVSVCHSLAFVKFGGVQPLNKGDIIETIIDRG